MTRRRKWIARIAGIALAPPALWVLFVTFAPTDWARVRLEERVRKATGRGTALGSLEIGLLGDVRLRDLRIEEKEPGLVPCFQIGELRLNIHLGQLLMGESGATEILADGVTMRVTRDGDGNFNLADLLEREPAEDVPQGHSSAQSDSCNGLTIRLRRGHLIVIDEPTRTNLEFSGVEGQALWTRTATTIESITGTLNEGDFRFEGRYDRSGPEPRFEGQMSARDVSLGLGMEVLTYVVPILPGADATMGGRLDLDLELRARGKSRKRLTDSLSGLGSLRLDPIQLDGSEILDEFCKLARIAPDDRSGTFQSDFSVRDRRVNTQETTLTVSRQPIQFSGWTDFDGQVDYQIQADSITSQLSSAAQDLLGELPVKLDDLASIHVRGNVGQLKLTIDGQGILGSKSEERAKLKKFGQRLLDKIRR